MDIENYISSGVLELYVLGTLTSTEMEEVRQYAAKYPRIAQEINAMEAAIEAYASIYRKKPPPNLLNKIIEAIEVIEALEDLETEKAEQANSNIKTLPSTPVAAPSQIRPNIYRFWAVAASILLLCSILLNLHYCKELKQTSFKLATLEKEKLKVASEMNILQANYKESVATVAVLKDPANVIVKMANPDETKKDDLATVYWNAENKNVYLHINNLPQPPAGKQYQLWALKDGKPIDAGIFDFKDTIQSLKSIAAADAFAVTLEPLGGRPEPTLAKLQVIGNI